MSIARLQAQLRSNDCAVTVLEDGTSVLLNFANETLLTLNDTGTTIVEGIRGGAAESMILQQLVDRYAVDEAAARADLAAFLPRLSRALETPMEE